MNPKLSLIACTILACLSTLNAEENSVVISKTIKEKPNKSFDASFLNDTNNVGPFGKAKNADIPYQINTIPKELIEDSQAIGLEDIIKFIPSTQIEMRGGAEVGRPQTRGFRSDVVSNTFYNGLQVFAVTAKPMEQFESVEILNGIAGTLYGP